MIVSVEGIVADVLADSLVVETGGIGYQVFVAPSVVGVGLAVVEAQAAHVPRRPRGPAGALRLPDARGARLLHAAARR